MNILITGATGYVGTHLLNKIDFTQHKICAVVRNQTQARAAFANIIDHIEIIECDNSLFKAMIHAFNPHIVIHLASYLTSKDDLESLHHLLESNIIFSSILLDALSDTDMKYFINTGSFSEYLSGAPELDGAYLYSATKIAFRAMLDFYSKKNEFSIINVIPFTIYGGSSKQKKAIDLIFDSLENPAEMKMTEGKQVLDFIHIDDVVGCYLFLINTLERYVQKYTELYLGTGIGTSIRELADKIEVFTRKKANIAWGSVPYRPRDIMHAVAPASQQQVDWKPQITLEEGLKKILAGRAAVEGEHI